MTIRLVPAAVATVLGLLGLIGPLGCGPAPVPPGEFTSRGNAVCAATAVRVARLVAPRAVSTRAPERMAGYVDAYVAELRQELAGLRLIGFPAGEHRRLARVYAELDAALTAVERDPLSFRPSAFGPATAELRAAGLTACR